MIASYCAILLVLLLLRVNAYPGFGARELLRKRQSDAGVSIDAESPFDHSWIESYAALGDSYTVGLGAGHDVSATDNIELNTDCYQYSYGYPNLLNADGMIGTNPNRKFQYLGCSGAKVPDITTKQVPKMGTSQVVTISAGGNDAHLATILNYCIYQWATWWPWTCNGELKSAENAINADQYTKDLQDLMTAVKPKLQNENSRIYWVGYEQFWDTSTNECDSVTWAFTRNWGFREYLTQDRRKSMNDLTDLVNSKIKSVCEDTPQCVFVDPSNDINSIEGHYCESGVDESYHWPGGGVSANREETWFYEWGTDKDNDDDNEKGSDRPQKRQEVDKPIYNNDTFEGAIAYWISEGLKNNSMDANITEAALGDFNAEGSALPDAYGRVFHHDKFANGVIAWNILNAMDSEQAKMMDQPAVTKTISLCENVSPATPTASACEGNQIQGDCVQGSLPTATPNSGPRSPVCNKVNDGDSNYVRFNSDKAKEGAAEYCKNLVSDKVVLDAESTTVKPGTVSDAAEEGGSISLAVLFDVSSCDPDTAPADQRVDFGSMSEEDCYMNVYENLAAACAQDSTWQEFDPENSLIGGVYGYQCALWSMSGTKE